MFGKTAEKSAGMPSGMEMMIGALLKSMGVSPDLLRGYIEDGKRLATDFVVAMQATSKGIAMIRAEQMEQRAMLEKILNATATAPGVEELYPAEELAVATE